MNETTGASLSSVSPRAEPGREPGIEETIRRRLGARSIVLVGLMGAGKTSVGRRLAPRLGLPFRDADARDRDSRRHADPDIFAIHGEAYFREASAG